MKPEDFNKMFARPLSGSNTWFLVSGATVEQVVAAIEPTMVRVTDISDPRWQDDKCVTVITGVKTPQHSIELKEAFDALRFRNQVVIMKEAGFCWNPAMFNRIINVDLEA